MAPDPSRSPRAVLLELATHPRFDDLARLVHALALSAYEERRGSLDVGLDEAATRLSLDEQAAETPYGNVLRAVASSAPLSAPERHLLAALIARGVALGPPEAAEHAARVAEALSWIGGHTQIDPLSALDAALGPKAEILWSAISELVQRHDDAATGGLDRPSAIVAVAALGRAEHPIAAQHRALLAVSLRDPCLSGLLPAQAGTPAQRTVQLTAERTAPPRSAASTVALTLTLILPFVALARLVGRYALGLRSPADVTVSAEGVRVASSTRLLGRTLWERKLFIPHASLAGAGREVRFPRLTTYVGIGALLVGSYVGVRVFVDGARGGSPELLGLGLGILVGALALDYALSSWPQRSPDRCRVVFQPRRGAAVGLKDVDSALADEALRVLSAK